MIWMFIMCSFQIFVYQYLPFNRKLKLMAMIRFKTPSKEPSIYKAWEEVKGSENKGMN